MKFALFDAEGQDPVLRASGQIEGLGTSPHLVLRSGAGVKLEDRPVPMDGADAHEWALQQVLAALRTHFPAMRVVAVGHRIVHGGPRYAEPLILSDAIIAELRK